MGWDTSIGTEAEAAVDKSLSYLERELEELCTDTPKPLYSYAKLVNDALIAFQHGRIDRSQLKNFYEKAREKFGQRLSVAPKERAEIIKEIKNLEQLIKSYSISASKSS